MFGLLDCNSFFASCEKVFRPDLEHKPVIVLSNNDGCVVSLTQEAKALGIHRGSVAFQIKDLIEKYDVAVFSSNYTLYGDMSSRVMSILAENVRDIDIYSIDEAFLDLRCFNDDERETKVRSLTDLVVRGTGIPVSTGVAPTKTLAKAAAYFAKHYPGYHRVCFIDSEEKRQQALRLLPVDEVWGVGRRLSKKLGNYGIHTAMDLTQASESWVRQMMTISGVQTWKELRGISCISTSALAEKQSICTSRSFSEMIGDVHTLGERVSYFASSCARKLRAQHSVCSFLTVYITTNNFREDLPQYANSITITTSVPTADTSELVSYAKAALCRIFKKNFLYKKAAVIVAGITSDAVIQQNLFDTKNRVRQRIINQTVDNINARVGRDKVRIAAEGEDNLKWLKREYVSNNYTTDFNNIIRVF